MTTILPVIVFFEAEHSAIQFGPHRSMDHLHSTESQVNKVLIGIEDGDQLRFVLGIDLVRKV